MKINPCLKCKETKQNDYYPEFLKWITFRSSHTYYAKCSACDNETDVQESLEISVQAWNDMNQPDISCSYKQWDEMRKKLISVSNVLAYPARDSVVRELIKEQIDELLTFFYEKTGVHLEKIRVKRRKDR